MKNLIKFVLALITFFVAGYTVAQDPASGRFGNAAGCVRENASRLPSEIHCGGTPTDEVVITHETELTTTVSLPAVVITDCQAQIALDYSQRGAAVRVEGQIENTMCPAASGSFVISVSTVNDSGVANTQEFAQSWQRTDDQPVSFTADYAIGDNVDLVRVRTLRSLCKCDMPE